MEVSLTRMAGAPVRAVGRGLKAAQSFWPTRRPWSFLMLPRTSFDYGKDIGDGLSSNVVVAVINWICRTFPEAPLQVVKPGPEGLPEGIPQHRMARLVERPNPYYSGVLLWMGTLLDWATSGNAYWIKRRNAPEVGGEPVELWWAPSTIMEPRWPEDGSQFISHYEYRPNPGAAPLELSVNDVVHFRYGMDPNNMRKGLSPLRTLFREIWTDEEASNFTAALMKNLGVPGVIISPEGEKARVSAEAAAEIKDTFTAKFGGDRRGEPMVMTSQTRVSVLSFSPEQMTLRELRKIPEERVTAIYGVAAIVVGFGAGLDRSTFSNFHEAREAAYEGNVIPTQRLMGADLTVQLLPDFDTDPSHSVAFDLSQVRVLQPDQSAIFERYDRGVRGGWTMVSTAKRATHQPVQPGDDVYLRPMVIEAVPATRVAKAAAVYLKADGSEAYAEQVGLMRRRLAKRHEAVLTRFFKAQAGRVRDRLSAVATLRSNGHGEQKALTTGGALLPPTEDAQLAQELAPLHLAALETGFTTTADAFALDVQYNAEDSRVGDAMRDAEFRATRINDGTRKALATALQEAEAAGYTARQLLNGVPADGFAGLAERTESYYAGRTMTIAATEAMWGTGRGAGVAYRTAGIRQVMMVDPGDDPPCQARNGRVVSVEQGESAMGQEHPNGNLALVPA